MNAFLKIEKLGKAYQSDRPVFSDVSFTIDKGEFVCIIGHSGCGKTTILNVLAGLDKAKFECGIIGVAVGVLLLILLSGVPGQFENQQAQRAGQIVLLAMVAAIAGLLAAASRPSDLQPRPLALGIGARLGLRAGLRAAWFGGSVMVGAGIANKSPVTIKNVTPIARLTEEAGVIVLPGSGFGAGGEGFFRISFIQSEERIAEAAKRAGAVLDAMLKELA